MSTGPSSAGSVLSFPVYQAGAHSLRHSAARHWLTTAGIPLNVVSQWLGHATPEDAEGDERLRVYLPALRPNGRALSEVAHGRRFRC